MGTEKGYQTAREFVRDTWIMTRDIEQIIERIRNECTMVEVEQLRVKFPADDDGIWFFKQPNCLFEVQLESPQGMCPFLIETNEHPERFYASSVEAAVTKLKQLLYVS